MTKTRSKKIVQPHSETIPSRLKRRRSYVLRKNTWIGGIIILAGFLIIFFFFSSFGRNILSLFTGLIFHRDIQLQSADDDSLNLLLLGIGGGTHDGPNLTDTIFYVHLDRINNRVDLVSIPRDLWIPQMSAKINSAYAYGKENGNQGILFVDAVVEKVIGQSIDYTIVGDFQGFIKLVDLIGGIDVDVKRTFTDNYYPIPSEKANPCDVPEDEIEARVATAASEFEVFPCRYEVIHFDKGAQTMDGERALLFVRSRHAEGEEGTDFARSRRQNQVIDAVRGKVLSLGTLTNPVKVLGMINILQGNISTNIDASEFDDFIKLAQKMQTARVTHYVIDSGGEEAGRPGLLAHPDVDEEYKFQWVLIPRAGNGDFSEIQEYIKCISENKKCEISKNGTKEE